MRRRPHGYDGCLTDGVLKDENESLHELKGEAKEVSRGLRPCSPSA